MKVKQLIFINVCLTSSDFVQCLYMTMSLLGFRQ